MKRNSSQSLVKFSLSCTDEQSILINLIQTPIVKMVTLSAITLLTPNFAVASTLSEDLFDIEADVGSVISPSKLKTPLSEVPASVTVITGDELRDYGITDIGDALRLVPGMFVAKSTPSDWKISYHGTHDAPRRMQILIDGVSFYRPGFAKINWTTLPIAIEQIKRIEVTRGPNAALYGANSFLGVVNIISRSPDTTIGDFASVTAGNQGQRELFLRHSDSFSNTIYTASAKITKDNGFDASSTFPDDLRDGKKLGIFNWRSITEYQDNTLDIALSHVQGTLDEQSISNFQQTAPDIDIKETNLSVALTGSFTDEHDWKVQFSSKRVDTKQHWQHCFPSAYFIPELHELSVINRQLAENVIRQQAFDPSTLSVQETQLVTAVYARFGTLTDPSAVMCGRTNQDLLETVYDLGYEGTYEISDSQRFVYGTGYRSNKAESETYLNGDETDENVYLFLNFEHRFTDALIGNFGGMYESGRRDIEEFSPRLALNYHVDDNHTLRFVTSKATRTPDVFETNADWSYAFTGLQPETWGSSDGHYFRQTTVNDAPKSEEITSVEVGLFANYPLMGLHYDIKVFRDSLDDLISGRYAHSIIDSRNEGHSTITGLEIDSGIRIAKNTDINLTYAYLDIETNQSREKALYARHSASLSLRHSLSNNWKASSVYYYQDQESFEAMKRIDFTLGKSIKLQQSTLDLRGTLRHYINEAVIVGSTGAFNYYDESNHLVLSASYSF